MVNIISLPYSVVLSRSITSFSWKYLLWFKFILGLMFFELVSIVFAIAPDYDNEYMTKENKN